RGRIQDVLGFAAQNQIVTVGQLRRQPLAHDGVIIDDKHASWCHRIDLGCFRHGGVPFDGSCENWRPKGILQPPRPPEAYRRVCSSSGNVQRTIVPPDLEQSTASEAPIKLERCFMILIPRPCWLSDSANPEPLSVIVKENTPFS